MKMLVQFFKIFSKIEKEFLKKSRGKFQRLCEFFSFRDFCQKGEKLSQGLEEITEKIFQAEIKFVLKNVCDYFSHFLKIFCKMKN